MKAQNAAQHHQAVLAADNHTAPVECQRDQQQQQQHDQRTQGQHFEHGVALRQLLDQRILDREQQQRACAEQGPGDGSVVIVQGVVARVWVVGYGISTISDFLVNGFLDSAGERRNGIKLRALSLRRQGSYKFAIP